MGTTSSSNNSSFPDEPLASLPRTNDEISNNNENSNQWVTSSTKTVDTMDEHRSQSTYAGQMTGWQPSGESSASIARQHDGVATMEFSRIISQLAIANRQLATAQSATLSHLETLYLELKRERESRKSSATSLENFDEEAAEFRRRRVTRDEEEKRGLESRVNRLENIFKERTSRETKDSSLVRDEDELSFEMSEIPSSSRGTECSKCRSKMELRDKEKVDRSRATISEEERERAERIANEEIARLSEKIERLKADRLEYQSTNERLLNDLADQRKTIERLTKDYEVSKTKCGTLESEMNECRQQYDQLMRNFDLAKKETERLVKEIHTFHLEKDTADARISSLEEDLRRSLLEKEEIKIENERALKLNEQLSEEISDRKKQVKALEDALGEIQRLKETTKTENKSNDFVCEEDVVDDTEEGPPPDRVKNIEEFKRELTLKREARQRAIAAVSSEMERLRRELDAEKEAHSETSRVLDLLRSAQPGNSADEHSSETDEISAKRSRFKEEEKPDENEIEARRNEAQRLSNILKVSDELRNDIRYQMEKIDDLRYHLETDPERHRYRIRCLVDVSNKTRESFSSRERKTNELKDQLAQILVRMSDKSFLEHKDSVGAECERHLENIECLKSLYNERLKIVTEMKDAAAKELADVKERLEHSSKKAECLEEDLKKADEKIDAQDTEISNLESQLGLAKADCRDLQNQMSLINGLFTQMLLGATSADMDLDRLTQLLQENHDLICDMAREEGTEAAALPKLLLDLVEQVEGSKGSRKRNEGEEDIETTSEAERKDDDLQQEDIAHNLPKVWRVLLELLSCHAVGTSNSSVASSSDSNSCYKSVDTPAGPRLVISVSKTYIRLKELILEKKHLEKEMNRMKQLNTHLESKLGEQEKRLSMVSEELTKTWNIVGRMQAQHQQLHTHEKILRYELQQKRKMLQELKQELEYCREKWESARQKNTNTELEWRSLRREFAARKALVMHDSFNNSAESGFSDERGDDSDEEDETVEGRIRLGPRRRTRKEGPRVPSPDTESEQPTDTELSEPKTGSSVIMEQRTPTPETEAELDEIEIVDQEVIQSDLLSDGLQDVLDPLDRALTNVIQNLIRIDDNSKSDSEISTPREEMSSEKGYDFSVDATSDLPSNEKLENEDTKDCLAQYEAGSSTETKTESIDSSNFLTESNIDNDTNTSSILIEKNLESDRIYSATIPESNINEIATKSVFSIGPFPASDLNIPKSVQFRDPLVVGPSNLADVSLSAPLFGNPVTFTNESSTVHDISSSQSQSSSKEEMEQNIAEAKPTSKSTESVHDSDDVSVDSSSSLETIKEFVPSESTSSSSTSSCTTASINIEAATASNLPATSDPASTKTTSKPVRTPEDVLAARADRLKRLEEQADWLMKKMNATNRRGSALSTRLEELHEVYGEPPVPPPMPDVLPSRRLRTVLSDQHSERPTGSTSEGNNRQEEILEKNEAEQPSSQNTP